MTIICSSALKRDSGVAQQQLRDIPTLLPHPHSLSERRGGGKEGGESAVACEQAQNEPSRRQSCCRKSTVVLRVSGCIQRLSIMWDGGESEVWELGGKTYRSHGHVC